VRMEGESNGTEHQSEDELVKSKHKKKEKKEKKESKEKLTDEKIEHKKSKKKKKNKKSKKESKGKEEALKESKEEISFNIRDHLSEEEKKTLDEFRQIVQPHVGAKWEEKWLTDMCLCRYLRARNWDIKKSTEMIKNSLEWRRSYQPHLITAEDVKIELNNTGKMYRNGFDKHGRPIIYMKPGKDNTGVPEKEVKVKYLVYLMEKASRAADESKGIDKFVWLVDYKDFNQLTGIVLTKVAKEILDILQDHYPERLGLAFIINAPWTFHLMWKMLQPFLTDSTKSKVRMISGHKFEEIQEAVDLDQLETAYGGNNTFTYDFDKYWNKEDLEFPIQDFPEEQKLEN